LTFVQFIRGIRVTDFRSIAAAALTDVGDVTPIVGLNGSGKSNLMRALNLFFVGVVESGVALDLRRDFREPGRQVKLRVQVEVDLDYSVFTSLRRELTDALTQLAGGSSRITVRKDWALDPVTREPLMSLYAGATGGAVNSVAPENLPLVTRLLNVVRFRYVPNHVHPSRILSDEEKEIRRMLFDRLGKRQVLQDQVVQSIGNVASELMQPILGVMTSATGDVATVELATPTDWRDLAWAFGMKMRGTQTQSFDALLHGSGVQSILAYAVLHAVDTSFSGTFGWRKGAIWALEEPESFLHVGLQEELARLLSSYGEGDPVQILFSTHATPFLGVSSRGLLAAMDQSGRTDFTAVDKADLLRVAYTTRISPFAHALHTGPPKAMLLVEGKNDRDLLLRAYEEGAVPNPFDVQALEDLDPTLQGGDDVVRWLKYNSPALAARPETSPVYALRDWESGQSVVNSLDQALSIHATSKCLVWPRDLTNPDLSDRFVGIEKFFSTIFFEHVRDTLGLVLTAPAGGPNPPTWRYDINRQDFTPLKASIHAELAQRSDPADIAPLIAALPWLASQLLSTPPLL